MATAFDKKLTTPPGMKKVGVAYMCAAACYLGGVVAVVLAVVKPGGNYTSLAIALVSMGSVSMMLAARWMKSVPTDKTEGDV